MCVSVCDSAHAVVVGVCHKMTVAALCMHSPIISYGFDLWYILQYQRVKSLFVIYMLHRKNNTMIYTQFSFLYARLFTVLLPTLAT